MIVFKKLWLQFALCVLVSGFSNLTFAQDEPTEEEYRHAREEMIRLVIRGAGIKDERVIEAMQNTHRHRFVAKKLRSRAYLDAGLPIGDKQTISSPFIVSFMTESLDPKPTDRVLEIGTGSGYQAAVLSPLVAEVFSIEIVETLGKNAAKVLKELDYKNVFLKIGDGYQGWAEHAPFDKIIVTCSPEGVPQPLIDQLAEGGLMVIPVGERYQQVLNLLKKENGKMVQTALRPTLFVPMTGKAETEREIKPDDSNPVLLNPSFEEGLDDEGFVKGWYYDRLVTWQEDSTVLTGKASVTFSNDVPGQAAHLLQGISIDGRKVAKLQFGGSVKYQNTIRGQQEFETPYLSLTFYDKDRRDISTEFFGPFLGNQASWKKMEKEIRVPVAAREAILRIGMFGATGVISFDNIVFKKID